MKRSQAINDTGCGSADPEQGNLQDAVAADVDPDSVIAAGHVTDSADAGDDAAVVAGGDGDGGAAAAGDLDPFDPARLRLSESEQIGVQKVLTTISCDKPGRQQFVRVHPDPTFRMDTATFRDELNRESYLVEPSLWHELAGDIQRTSLFAAVTRRDTLFLWPVRIPDPDRPNPWHVSQREAVDRATTKWIRMASNMDDGRYDLFEATGYIPEPNWPEMEFREMLELCFSDRFINSLDHPVLQQLRGAV